MKKIYLYFAMLATVAAACTKDESVFPQDGNGAVPADTPEVKMITETISARSGSQTITRATIADADGAFSWSAGDHIAVHVSKDSNHEYVFTSEEGGSGATVDAAESFKATFTVAYQMGYTRDAFAIFPSTIVSKNATNYGQSGSTLDVTLPSSYTLDQVATEKTPCPMISANDHESTTWDFYQLCGLLRLTANSIPTNAKRLEINFGENMYVAGNFSIPSPAGDGSSAIAIENASGSNSTVITITKDGTDTTLGGESLVLNIPLPTGTYTDLMVTAYDAITGGNSTRVGIESFAYTAANTKAVKKATTLSNKSIFKFTFRNNNTVLTNLRFVRGFSNLNKLHNGETTFGPFTESDSENNLPSTIEKTLEFDPNPGDQFVFQVVGADGKVYAGSIDAPAGGYAAGQYDLTIDVIAYTFTISAGKKVYFSPGDLGVDSGVYSFTEPFADWEHGNTKAANNAASAPAKRVWFDIYHDGGIITSGSVYGISGWRSPGYVSSAYEWNNIVNRTMNDGVAAYYRVTIPGHQYCLLLPPDETQSTDIGDDLTSGNVTDYAKYLAKGFVLLFNTNRGLISGTKWSWGSSTGTFSKQGYYWSLRDGSNRYYFETKESGVPAVSWGANRMRNHVRYVIDVVN